MTKTAKRVITVAFLAMIGFVVYSTLTLSRHACEVCMELDGREACRTAWGTTREEALSSAIDNACARIAQGRTESMRCARTPPNSVRCEEGG